MELVTVIDSYLQPFGSSMQLYASSIRLDPSRINSTSYQVADFPFGKFFGPQSFRLLDDDSAIEFFGVMYAEGLGTIYSSDFNVCNVHCYQRFLII